MPTFPPRPGFTFLAPPSPGGSGWNKAMREKRKGREKHLYREGAAKRELRLFERRGRR